MSKTVFRLRGGTAEQRRIVRLAFQDLSYVLHTTFVARTNGPVFDRQIHIDDGLFRTAADADALAYHEATPGLPSCLIALRESLEGAELYTTLLHELGHYFGLPHSPTGIMKGAGRVRPYPLTLRRRQRAVADLARRIVQLRSSALSA